MKRQYVPVANCMQQCILSSKSSKKQYPICNAAAPTEQMQIYIPSYFSMNALNKEGRIYWHLAS